MRSETESEILEGSNKFHEILICKVFPEFNTYKTFGSSEECQMIFMLMR